MYRRSKQPTMQFKPNLSNINPADLDEYTRQNMNAVGINFSTKQMNRLKPFESQSSKRRKWRNYFSSQKQSLTGRNSRTVDRRNQNRDLAQNANVVDYDGSSSNVEKVQILQRRLTAWPTFDKASGIGNDPAKLVGTNHSNAIDHISYMNATEQ